MPYHFVEYSYSIQVPTSVSVLSNRLEIDSRTKYKLTLRLADDYRYIDFDSNY